MDCLRSLAMLLGLVLHAPQHYYIPQMSVAYNLPEINPWIMNIVYWIHSWRMPVFFLIAGFFASLIVSKQGVSYFSRDRIIRIGFSLLFFASVFDLLDGQYTGDLKHLWFLYYLLLISLFFALIYNYRQLPLLRPITLRLGSINRLPTNLASFCILLSCCVIIRVFCDFIDGGNVHPPRTFIDIQLGSLLYFSSWFCLGLLLHQRLDILAIFSKKNVMAVSALAGITIFPAMLAYSDGIYGILQEDTRSLDNQIIGSIVSGSMALFGVLFIVGATNAFIKQSTPLIKWLVELSFPIYVIHLLPSEKIAETLITEGFSQTNVFILTILLTFSISVIIYYFFIKFTPLNWIINGYRKSWLQPPFSKK